MTTPTPPGLVPERFFDDAEYARRHAAVRAAMAARGIDVLLCTTPENVYYLSGYQTIAFSSYQLLIFPADGAPCLVLRFLESMLAARYSVIQDVVAWDDTDDPIAVTLSTLRERGLSGLRIGYEEQTSSNPVTLWASLKAGLPTMTDGSGLVEVARAVKSDAELACMRKAAVMTDAGVAAAIAETRVGATENDVAAAAFNAMTRAGSEPLAKDPIVTSGIVAACHTPATCAASWCRAIRSCWSSAVCIRATIRRSCVPVGWASSIHALPIGRRSAWRHWRLASQPAVRARLPRMSMLRAAA